MDECPVDRDRCGIGRIPRSGVGRAGLGCPSRVWGCGSVEIAGLGGLSSGKKFTGQGRTFESGVNGHDTNSDGPCRHIGRFFFCAKSAFKDGRALILKDSAASRLVQVRRWIKSRITGIGNDPPKHHVQARMDDV